MITVGFVGWRGMVGAVLLERMRAEGDFNNIEPVFFSTSQVGQSGPQIATEKSANTLEDAYDMNALANMDIIVSCHGSEYTAKILPALHALKWSGYWIDASSYLRLHPQSIIVLDPINRTYIDQALDQGIKQFIGGNCTVSLMLMAIGALCQKKWVQWISAMTYQAASGAGARCMEELLKQMQCISQDINAIIDHKSNQILDIDRHVSSILRDQKLPNQHLNAPLAGNVLPWIDRAMPSGHTREEWKGQVESNRILGNPENTLIVDGICVRVGSMRSHSQALTIKLTQDIPIDEIESIIDNANPWTRIISNDKTASLSELTPVSVSGTLSIPVGRLRKMNLGAQYLAAFTTGDQLLWGASEPIRRVLSIIVNFIGK